MNYQQGVHIRGAYLTPEGEEETPETLCIVVCEVYPLPVKVAEELLMAVKQAVQAKLRELQIVGDEEIDLTGQGPM